MIDYREHVKTCAPDDFWGQVKRTVDGKPIGQDQIDMIVAACVDALDLQPGDTLLDLCCGNGALSRYLFGACRGGLGVDISEALIDVAKANFEVPGREDYIVADVAAHVASAEGPERFTKALCYGSFPYIEAASAAETLGNLSARYPNIQRLFIGNLPDKSLMSAFFHPGAYTPGVEDDPRSAIGIWRTKAEFVDLARHAGWIVEFRQMPAAFYAAHYRYDAVLRKAG